jgi:maltooligosyltrehalose trehalohydrolase
VVEQPFTYFADHQAPLAELVRNGRLEFLSQFPSFASTEVREQLPVPNDEAMFHACRLDWRETSNSRDARRLYGDLIALRRNDAVVSAVGTVDVSIDSSAPTQDLALIRYSAGEEVRLLVINFGSLITCPMNDPLLAPGAGRRWELLFCSERSTYGGNGVDESFDEGCWRLQAHCAWFFQSTPRAATKEVPNG